MADRDRKIVLMRELHENKSLQAVRAVVELLNLIIDETREANDEAQGTEFVRNQGKIEACKTLRDVILKDPPPKDLSQGINLA